MPQPDALALVEAAYRLDLNEADWLGALADAALPLLDRGLGVLAYTVDTRTALGTLGPLVARPNDVAMVGYAQEMLAVTPPPMADAILRVPIGFGASSELAGPDAIAAFLAGNQFGMVDTAAVQGLDVGGDSVWVVIPSQSAFAITSQTREKWQRVACHLAAAIRLRRWLERESIVPADLDHADAVFETDFSTATATVRGQPVLEKLRAYAKDVDKARGRMRHEAPEEALALWRGLCDGEWTLVDHFDSDGRRYLVARHNEPDVRALHALTRREQQVVAFVAQGHSDKIVSYELGIAEPTVQGHLRSAMQKMGITSRTELVRAALALAARPPT